jgi:fatty acid desaturase
MTAAPAHFNVAATAPMRAELRASLDTAALRALHRKSGFRHALTVARLLGLQAIATWVILSQQFGWWAEAIAIVWTGFTAFNFTVLLHDVLHGCVFAHRRPRAEALLKRLYAFPSGISATQFTRWHLAHHDQLGDGERDPKRHHLSPKRASRLLKFLYATPALFPIYFRAAARENKSYPVEIQRVITRERLLTIGGHLAVAVTLGLTLGAPLMLKAYLIPYLFVFPIAFTLNRLGQHYAIDPADPRKWTTRMRAGLAWDFLYLNSTYHLEHHAFPSVPLHNLRGLAQLMAPYYEKIGHRAIGYGTLIAGWFARNEVPHTKWAALQSTPNPDPATAEAPA